MFFTVLSGVVAGIPGVVESAGIDITSDTYWDVFSGFSNEMSFDGSKWVTTSGTSGTGLINVNQTAFSTELGITDIRPNILRVTVNSGNAVAGGALTGSRIDISDENSNVRGTNSFDFTEYNQELVRDIELELTSSSDMYYFIIETLLQNDGPWVTKIEYIE